MKKLAFALAMLIALTGCLFALASCGEEEESSAPAESSATASETPAASSEEAPAASSEEAPAESSEEAPAESSEEAPATSEDEPGEASETDVPDIGDSVLFWVTHFNDGQVEGAGTIFTETDEGGAWWHHVSFKPVDGMENVFEVVEISRGDGGAGVSLTIPEGGFVYAVNIGNNWPELCAGLTGDGSSGLWYDDEKHLSMPNYVTVQVTDAFAWAGALSVGQQFLIEGVDLEKKIVPTTTPDLNWYESGYICTANIAPLK